jgi:hypothetical protein
MPDTILFAKRALAAVAVALGMIVCCGMPAQAQSSDSKYSMLLLGVDYGAPERFSGSVSGLFLIRDKSPMQAAGRFTPLALEIRGRVGLGGYEIGIGPRIMRYGPFTGPEAMLTVTRTFSSPRTAIGRSTYVGVEVGYNALGRVTIGVAQQVDGPADQRDTMLTWSVGVQIPYGFWRW